MGNKIAFTIGRLTKTESYFIIYKSNEKTSYLNTKLIKTVNVSVLKSNYKRKVSTEKENVVTDGGEGRFFCSWVMRWELQKMLSWSHWQARWVSGFFT